MGNKSNGDKEQSTQCETTSNIHMRKTRRKKQRATIRTIIARKSINDKGAMMNIKPIMKSEVGPISHWQSDLSWLSMN